MSKLSPLAPASFPNLPPVEGVRLSVAESGIRYKNRPDLLLAAFAPGTTAAGVLTLSKVVAAPVTWCRQQLAGGTARALIVNAGNANAFTGIGGMQSVKRVTAGVAHALKCKANDVLMASTGVIGEPLPDGKITAHLPALAATLSPKGWSDAARAIMTTDTFMKVATRTARIGGVKVIINGIAKGSGMIAPDMATLLAFVFTDAAIPARVLKRLLAEANDASFNAITVDGDTSTNDTLLAFATAKAKHKPVKSGADAHVKAFKAALSGVLTDLALQVVKDGEGAEKLITIEVKGAASDKAARIIGLTIANSPLVKTAIAGCDANWGRIVAAAGRSGQKVVQEKIEVIIGDVPVARAGARVAGFDETPVAAHMKGRDIRITVDMHLGKGKATVYTCDLTHGYIDINGSYRS
jgi:glutamate N-acetyltransferase/amino-acid N-acetyltransferase